MRIGIAVEGPSDKKFCDLILKKEFPQVRFFIQSFGSRTTLIRNGSQLLKQWKERNFTAGFILIDRDSDPCISELLHKFDASTLQEAKKPYPERNFFIIVAIREIESWFLADEDAIHSVFPHAKYKVSMKTDDYGAEGKLKRMWKEARNSSFNKKLFAEFIAPLFDPNRAMNHSRSFTYFWSHLQETLKKTEFE